MTQLPWTRHSDVELFLADVGLEMVNRKLEEQRGVEDVDVLFADHSESVTDELLARHRKWPWTRHSDVEQFLMKWDWRWLIGTSKNK